MFKYAQSRRFYQVGFHYSLETRSNHPIGKMYSWIIFLCYLQYVWAIPSRNPLSQDQTLDIVAIKQTINLFAVLADGHEYDQLNQVFTPNATADFGLPGGSILRGLPAITAELSELSNVTSQHEFTTQYVNFLASGTANATSYFIGVFFGSKANLGQTFTEYGRFVWDPSQEHNE